MDFISIMTYDLHGSWEDVTGHNSPLYAHSGETGKQRYLNMVKLALTLTFFCFQIRNKVVLI
jgi:GH18 family chitinase